MGSLNRDHVNDWFFQLFDDYFVTAVESECTSVTNGRREVTFRVVAMLKDQGKCSEQDLAAEVAALRDRVRRLESEDVGKKLIGLLRKSGVSDDDYDEYGGWDD